jgi:hypothetical protein
MAALFTALAVIMGYLLAGVPNIELMTLTVFLAGVFLGARMGAVVGALSILFYSLFNPFGPPMPPLLVSQLAGFCLVGVSGGIMGPLFHRTVRAGVVASGAAGFIVTVVYDVLTTVATVFIAVGAGGFGRGFWGIFLAGVTFTALHALSNTALFAAAVVPIVRVASVWERGGGG